LIAIVACCGSRFPIDRPTCFWPHPNKCRGSQHLGESFDGDLTFAYVRLGVLSAAWIVGEHSMISNPAGFYTITES
jgi:hypothetical protein